MDFSYISFVTFSLYIVTVFDSINLMVIFFKGSSLRGFFFPDNLLFFRLDLRSFCYRVS